MEEKTKKDAEIVDEDETETIEAETEEIENEIEEENEEGDEVPQWAKKILKNQEQMTERLNKVEQQKSQKSK